MCLYVKNRNQGRNQCVLAPEIVKKPIRCLKVVLKIVTQPYKYDENISKQFRDYVKTEYVSPWRREPWHDKFTYSIGHIVEHNPKPLFGSSKDIPLRAERHYCRGENEGYNYTVDPGIHTWNAKSPGAEKYVSWLKEHLSKHSYGYPYCCATPVILECEIPAGTKYYTEWGDGSGGGCLCSDFLRVTGWKKPGADEPWHDTPGPMCTRLDVWWRRLRYTRIDV